VILLALPDALLEGFASSLPVRPGTAVLHLSGSLDSSCLEGLPAGVHRGCYHPLQAFRAETSGRFQPPPYCVAVEGDSHAVRAARVLAKATGHPCVEIPAGGKAAYHAAAVLASNCLVALQDTACRVLGHAGVQEEDRWKLLWPLVAGTLSNLEDGRFAEAITGPVSRGDIGTVQRNLQAIGQDAAASEIYRLLGLASLELAAHGRLDPARTEEIRAVLVGQGH